MTSIGSRRVAFFAIALGILAWTAAPAAHAEELSLGVFLPQSAHTTNAERSAYAEAVASALTAATGGSVTFRARAFGLRSDVMRFMAARTVDLLITDGLLLGDSRAEVIAHASPDPAVALYGNPGDSVLALRGQVVAVAEAGDDDVNFYANTALSGEVAPRTYFADIRRAKDASAAFGAVRTNAARAAFAPDGHPAGAGLEVLARGGELPIAVVVVVNPARLDERTRAAVVSALVAGAGVGGGITSWRGGPGASLKRARSLAQTQPRVLTTPPLLASAAEQRLTPPPLRLRAVGRVGSPSAAPFVTVTPTLSEP